MDDTPRPEKRTALRAYPRVIRPTRLLYAGGVWLGLAVLAILNAGVREVFVAPVAGDYWGHVTSTVTFIAALSVVSYLYFTRYTEHSVRELVAIGSMWFVMTVLFEFGFGHYVMGNTWEALLRDYNVLAGRVWVLVLLALLVAPVVFGHYLQR